MKLKMKKGDKVIVLAGKDKGKRGEVLKMFPAKGKAIVSGVNRVKRHTRPSQANPGGIIEKELPIQISNLAVEDPRDGKATRVGYKFLADGSKVRIAKRSGEMIDG
ncbi:MAG: 50S ribosomal protein L24 [Alphaproteobacteria bacterium]|nr:MAG: 50S ribosomal protein L24 [Alphaproteobacteria bacterium]